MLSWVGPRLRQRHVEAAPGDLGHARRVVHVPLVLGDLGEDRQLLGLLEAAEAHAHRAGLGRDHHHRRMRPVGGCRRGHEVGDAGAVLRDAHAVAARDARIAVGHVAGALLVHGRDEADAGGREKVERVHVGRADDAEHVLDAVRDQRLHEGFAGRHLGHGGAPGMDVCCSCLPDRRCARPRRYAPTFVTRGHCASQTTRRQLSYAPGGR